MGRDDLHWFKISNISAKLDKLFRYVKSDAVPKPPQPENERTDDVTEENDAENLEQEEVVIEPEDSQEDEVKKPKTKNKFSGASKKKNGYGTSSGKEKKGYNSTNSVNVQATGTVYNIVDCSRIRVGHEYVYILGAPNATAYSNTPSPKEPTIKKTVEITFLMKATEKPEHDYIDCISKNLGNDWQKFFIGLGYSQGRLETYVIDESGKVSEARYQILLDWMRNDDDGSLGRLATLLWEAEEREIVQLLATMYKKNKE